MVRLRRADVIRIQKELNHPDHGIGMYLTDFFHTVSYMTSSEVYKMAGTAAERAMTEWRERDKRGEVPRIRPDELRDDAEEHLANKQNTAPEGGEETDQ